MLAMPHKMHPSPAFMMAGVAVVRFLCGLFSASASTFVRSKGVAGERERENWAEKLLWGATGKRGFLPVKNKCKATLLLLATPIVQFPKFVC